MLRPRCPQHWYLTPEEKTMRWRAASHSFLELKDKRSGLEALEVIGRGTMWVTLDTFSSTLRRLRTKGSEEAQKTIRVVETKELAVAIGV